MNWATIELRLAELAVLRAGWDSYGAEAPSAAALSSAQYFLSASADHFAYPRRVNPSVVGGVGVTYGRRPGRTVYVEFRNTGSALVAWADGADGAAGGAMGVAPVPGDPSGEFFRFVRSFTE